MNAKVFVGIILVFSQLCAVTSKAAQFEIDGVVLGEVATGKKNKYECKPSDQFENHTWCSSFLQSGTGKGKSSTRQSVLLAPDGRALYLNRVVTSFDFQVGDLKGGLDRRSAESGLTPTLLKPPAQLQSPDRILAIWGNLKVVEVDDVSKKVLAAGKSPRIGFLIDFLNDIEESARLGFPIYRLAEGKGYVWSVSFGQHGISRRRSIAADISSIMSNTNAARVVSGKSKSSGSASARKSVILSDAGEVILEGVREKLKLADKFSLADLSQRFSPYGFKVAISHNKSKHGRTWRFIDITQDGNTVATVIGNPATEKIDEIEIGTMFAEDPISAGQYSIAADALGNKVGDPLKKAVGLKPDCNALCDQELANYCVSPQNVYIRYFVDDLNCVDQEGPAACGKISTINLSRHKPGQGEPPC